ncbi:hypothetical protein LARV_00642 [Longilinea arvoryzae]|uniref:Uncharacterized protein n=1 Tax=Longilinea arvoryzae TaxID=360412 RepID=A0A0S7BEQ3_9CHLR|nr:hypothetical protein [Longilinea arvoryzae]GAP12902.1 hypothetical protein LARV_00642 [Longilinea arvoryzae]
MLDLTTLRARLRAWLSDSTGLALSDGLLDEAALQALDAINRAGATGYSVQGLGEAPITTLPAALEILLVHGAGALAAEGAAVAAERLLEPDGQRTTVLVAWGRAQYGRFQIALAELRARQMQSGLEPPYAAWGEAPDV